MSSLNEQCDRFLLKTSCSREVLLGNKAALHVLPQTRKLELSEKFSDQEDV
jgi:hypothetical protein